MDFADSYCSAGPPRHLFPGALEREKRPFFVLHDVPKSSLRFGHFGVLRKSLLRPGQSGFGILQFIREKAVVSGTLMLA